MKDMNEFKEHLIEAVGYLAGDIQREDNQAVRASWKRLAKLLDEDPDLSEKELAVLYTYAT